MLSQSKKVLDTAGVRKNTIQSGLYFFLFDLREEFKKTGKKSSAHDSAFSTLLNDLNLEFNHSNTSRTARHAIYLNLIQTDFLPNVFDGSTKHCHLSVDRDYLEFEGGERHEKLRWTYCHYTEEYNTQAGVQVLHIYFDSNGRITEHWITDSNGRSRDLTAEEKSKIYINERYATDIVLQLINCKMERCRNAVNRLHELAKQVSTLNDPTFVNTLLSDYDVVYQLAQRLADTHLILETAADIATIQSQLKEEANLVTEDAIAEEENSAQQAKSSSRSRVAAKSVSHEVSPKILELLQAKITQAQAILQIKATNDPKFFRQVAELAEISNFIIINLNRLPDDSKKIATAALKKIASVNIAESLRSQIVPKAVTLEFIKAHFKLIEDNCDDSFYVSMIQAAVKATEADKAAKFIEICEFLHKNSFRYSAVLQQANQISTNANGKQENPATLEWLKECFFQDKKVLFIMLLSHGVNLGANTIFDKDTTTLAYTPLFKNLFTILFSVTFNKSPKLRELFLTRCNEFLKIMLLPEFMAGASYEVGMRARLPREVLAARMRDYRKKLQVAERSGGQVILAEDPKSIIDSQGFFSVLDVAINLGLPDSTIDIIVASLEKSDVALLNIAQDFGKYFSDQAFLVEINKTTEPKITRLAKIAIISEDQIHDLLQFFPYIREQQPDGCIELRFFLVANPEHITPADLFKQEHLLAVSCGIMERFRELLLAKMHDFPVQAVMKEAGLMLSLAKPENITQKNTEKHRTFVGTVLGALLLLANISPPQNKLLEYYSLMYKAFCKLLFISSKFADLPFMNKYGDIVTSMYEQISHSSMHNKNEILACFDNIKNETNIRNSRRLGLFP